MQLDDVQLTGIVLLPVALFGAVCNWAVVFILNKLSTFRHSFGYLSASQAIADAVHSTVFLIYCCSMAITDNELLKKYSRHPGFLLLFSYELSVQTHLVMSLNRFFAVWTPYKYKTMFSDQNTKILIGLVWLWTFCDLTAVLGALANSLVISTARYILTMNNSFGLITKHQAACNILICLVYLCYIFPMQLISVPFLLDYSQIVGIFLMIIYEVSVASHLVIALNRLCTVFFPSHYAYFFSSHVTEHARNAVWAGSTIFCVGCHLLLGCRFEFNEGSRSMELAPSDTCSPWLTGFVLNLSLVTITLSINSITLYKVAKENRKRSVAVGIRLSLGQQKRKFNFLMQTFCQGSAIFIGQLSYHFIVPLVRDTAAHFFFASLWAYLHCLEGFIILTTNPDIRRSVSQSTRKGWRNVVSTVENLKFVKHFRR